MRASGISNRKVSVGLGLCRECITNLSWVYTKAKNTSKFPVCLCHAHRVQKKVPGPLELELQLVVSCEIWMLGTELCPKEG